jgi:membrane protein DedA with SNARE-associated domain
MLDHFTAYGYVGVFAALIASGFGFPIPEELPVLTAGVLAGHPENSLRWYIMLPTCILGVVIGDGCLYGIGRFWGPRLLRSAWVQRKFLPADKREKIEKNFHDRGILILLTARLTPGIRSPIFLMAGVLRVPLGRFLLADGLYAIPGVSTLFFLAYFLTDQVMEIFVQVEKYRSLVIVAILSAVIGILVYRFFTHRSVATGEHSEVPLMVRPIEMVTEAATHAVEATVDKAVHAAEMTIEAVTHLGHHEKPADPPKEPAETDIAPLEDSRRG